MTTSAGRVRQAWIEPTVSESSLSDKQSPCWYGPWRPEGSRLSHLSYGEERKRDHHSMKSRSRNASLGRMEALGYDLRSAATLRALTEEVVKSSDIEGEILNEVQVRSSLARRLGLDVAGLVPSDRHVDGVVEMLLDATQRFSEPLTADRLASWHAALFPTGRAGMTKIAVGAWRTDASGPMQVVSGRSAARGSTTRRRARSGSMPRCGRSSTGSTTEPCRSIRS